MQMLGELDVSAANFRLSGYCEIAARGEQEV